MLAFVTLAVRVPVVGLAKEIAEKILCAVSLGDECGPPGLDDVYGAEIATLVREYSPGLIYETGMNALPVDFRNCRITSCSGGEGAGERRRSREGVRVSAFVHVVDCRAGASPPGGEDCSGVRSGNLYLQYFFYYPESATLRAILGDLGHHDDDWESFGVRIGPDGEAHVRASSHHGYNYELGVSNWGSDAAIGPLKDLAELAGARPRGGWGPDTGWLFVSGGSHAGNAKGDLRRIGSWTTPEHVNLIPLEPIAAVDERAHFQFAVDPPWRKDVWADPEAEGTN
jgi:hypothetical protein